MTPRRSIAATAAIAACVPTVALGARPAANLGHAKAAAAAEIYKTFFQLNPKIAAIADERVRINLGCRRLTAVTFRCDWTGENRREYTAAGVVRVIFDRYGTDAVLSANWRCYPEGDAYEVTGVSSCPKK